MGNFITELEKRIRLKYMNQGLLAQHIIILQNFSESVNSPICHMHSRTILTCSRSKATV